ncbi:MAG TPA: AAA family ATPase [Candidatus Acidoferrales bacterium]|nr:AAA family ATPase [Candidatus Acidoferrales bacterium]
MKLRSISVEHFRGIRRARVEFGVGLNVLYGPNDLGKSSLAEAVRAALLLQVSAKYTEDFLNWHGTGEPSVELVFESEPQRIWRVRKTFGSGAQAFLDESRDGVDFQVEARGRDVEGRLREILRWGLAPPGGKGGQKGMPFTFLTTALLAEQDRVAAIFDQALSNDSDESGKRRLIEALQAVAEDPLFKSVLGRVQAHVDEAFTSTGRKKLGKNSPWVQVRDLIKRAEEAERQCHEQSQRTTAIEMELRDLLSRQMERKSAAEDAQHILQGIEDNHARGRQRAEILGRLKERQAKLDAITQELQELAGAEELTRRLAGEVEESGKRERSASAAVEEATERARAAKDEVAHLESEDRARERLLRQSSLEKIQAELRTEQVRNQAAIDLARAVETAGGRVRSAESESRRSKETVRDLDRRHNESLQAVQVADERERALKTIGQIIRCQAARSALEEAENGLAQTGAWRADADEKRAGAAALENAQPKVTLPAAALISDLKQLETQLQIAQARVSVGLHVLIRPKRGLRVSVRRDSEASERHELKDSPLETSATGRIVLDLERVAEITFSGGAQKARDEVDLLQKRWLAEAEPVLQLAGVTTLEALTRLSLEVAQRGREIQVLLTAAGQLELRVADQPDWATLRAQRERELAAADEAVGQVDREGLGTLARQLRIARLADAEAQIEKLRVQRANLSAAERKLDGQLTVATARSEEIQRTLTTALQELALAQSRVAGDWQVLLPDLLTRRADLGTELSGVQAELKTLAAETDQTIAEAHKALAIAETCLREAEAGHQKAMDEFRSAEKRQASSEGELKMRRDAGAKLDRNAAREAVHQVQAELQGVAEPLRAIADEVLTEALRRVETARKEVREIEDAIQSKRGALEHVGGDVARQRTEAAQEAVKVAREKEQEQETDFAAWELLRSTLQEAEQEEGAHLGRALAGPIARRFTDLTERRYGEIALGPDLETHTISAAGDGRFVSSLSVGTRDQLSTIFRLSLAEQLRSTVMLDDQLTQSDTKRMDWLRNLIRQLAANIQIVVFTCRPEDYLLPNELKAGKKSEAGAPFVRSINLAQVIERSGTA